MGMQAIINLTLALGCFCLGMSIYTLATAVKIRAEEELRLELMRTGQWPKKPTG